MTISTTLGAATSLFNYTGDGARLRQIIAGVPTTYTQDLAAPLPVVLQSQTGANVTRYVYALGTRPLAQYANDTAEYLLADALGSVRQIVDVNGNVTLAESYEPYGSVLTSHGTASSIFGYAGEQVDTYIKLLFLRSRYYSPYPLMSGYQAHGDQLKNFGAFYVRSERDSWVFKFNPAQRLRKLFGWSSTYTGGV